MTFDKKLVAGKLRRWDVYLKNYQLPAWGEIPDLGLYMEQVVLLLKGYLDYYSPELKEEQFISAPTINNYVRRKIMPEPVKKRYYRNHIAYLIIICTMKNSLSIPTLQTMIPLGLTDEELQKKYTEYVAMYSLSTRFFAAQVRLAAGPILDHKEVPDYAIDDTENLIVASAVIGGFARLFAEKLLLLDGKKLEDGGCIEAQDDCASSDKKAQPCGSAE